MAATKPKLSAPAPMRLNDAALVLHETGGESRVDSRIIAAHLGVQHESSMRTITDYPGDFESLGILRFEVGEIRGRGQPVRFALLNEDQAHLLLAYSRNTARVRALKLKLVIAFRESRNKTATVGIPAIEETDELSSVADRRPIYRAAADFVAIHHMSFPNAYRALSLHVGVPSLRLMTKRDVATADRFATRYLCGLATPGDFDRIEHNRTELLGESPQMALFDGAGRLLFECGSPS